MFIKNRALCMLKIFLLLFSLSLLARENPFFPLNSELDIPLTTNQISKAPELKRAALSLPSTARELQSITIKYKNLDGSISEKSITLDNSIDWHLPLFISQNYELNQQINRVKKKHTIQKEKFLKIVGLKFITLEVSGKKMKIHTKDELLRKFLLVKPHRIVCDFKRDIDLRSYEKVTQKGTLFTKIRIGSHKGYYRVVITLDGFYNSKIQKNAKGYLITLH
jgi:hypothetical protein